MTGDIEAYLRSVKWLREGMAEVTSGRLEIRGQDCLECGRFIPDGDVPPGPLHDMGCSHYDGDAWKVKQ